MPAMSRRRSISRPRSALERAAQPRVAPPVGAAVGRGDDRERRPRRIQAAVAVERVAGLPGEQPRRLARRERLDLALVLVQDGVRAIAAGAAPVHAQALDTLARHRFDGPAPQLLHGAGGHRWGHVTLIGRCCSGFEIGCSRSGPDPSSWASSTRRRTRSPTAATTRALEARVAHGAALLAARARTCSTSAASRRAATVPPVAVGEEIARVVPLIERLAARTGALVSVDTYKPEVAEAAIAAGAALVNDVSGLRDPAVADVCARDRRGARAHAHARGAEGHAARSRALRRRRRRRRRVPARADGRRAVARASRRSRSCSTRGRTSPRRRRRPSRCCARLDAAARARAPAAAGGLAQGLRRRDHRPRARASAIAGTLAALALRRRRRGARSLRVHDVAAAADFLAVRAVLRGERELAPGEGLTPGALPGGASTR